MWNCGVFADPKPVVDAATEVFSKRATNVSTDGTAILVAVNYGFCLERFRGMQYDDR
jgi:hypothetical protein